MSQIIFQKYWFVVFEVKVTKKDHIIKIWISVVSSEVMILLRLNLVLMAYHHKLDCLVKRMDCSVVVKDKVTEKVQNSSEYSSGLYLLNCQTFCNQTCCCELVSWCFEPSQPQRITSGLILLWCFIIGQSVLQENWFAVFKCKSQWGWYDFFYHSYRTADLFATKVYWMVHQRKLECFV